MAGAKKRPKIQARDLEVGSRTLEGILIDLAEQVKANDARCAERAAQADERASLALQTIAAVSQDLRALTQELRAFAVRTEKRLDLLEKAGS